MFRQRQANLFREFDCPPQRKTGCCAHLSCEFFVSFRAEYGPTYYAAFLIDPNGNNAEAVGMG